MLVKLDEIREANYYIDLVQEYIIIRLKDTYFTPDLEYIKSNLDLIQYNIKKSLKEGDASLWFC